MRFLVQKFGGTSVRNQESRKHAIRHIQQATEEGYKVVVVVSAMGRKGEPYATDTLLDLVNYPNTRLTAREMDVLMSTGELISSIVMANELQEQGMVASALSGPKAGILTTNDHMDARINKVIPDELLKYFRTNDVVVVAGFQGEDEDGNITTLGRGGSDTSAVALGAALEADYVDIFTDVNGIKTADPGIVKNAKTLKVMTYNEIVHLAYEGSKVIHPRAVEIAMQEKIQIRVRSTYLDDEGTLVTFKKTAVLDRGFKDQLVTGIAHQAGITQVNVTSAEEQSMQLHDRLLNELASAGISVDFFNIFSKGLTFTVPNDKLTLTQEIVERLDVTYELNENCAKVSAVGAGIQGVPGVAAKVVSALAEHQIQILQSADSHTTIWLLIKETDLEKAVNALHDKFLLNT